jgi:hypothetical protein
MRIRTAAILCCSAFAAAGNAAPATASPPVVTSIERSGPEHNKGSYQQFTIHFDQGVYGLAGATNVQVKRHPDGYGQPADVNFADGNSFAGVGVGTPSGTGTIAVHLINAGNIENAAHEHMIGGDNFAEVAYYVDRDGPISTLYPDPLTGGVTSASPVRFLLDIDEAPIQGLTGSSVHLSGTAGATTAAIVPDGGDPHDRVIEVSGMTGPGSVVVDLPPDAFQDELGNPSAQVVLSPASAGTAQYTGAGTPAGDGGGQLPVGQVPIGQIPIGQLPPAPSPAPPPAPAAPKLALGKLAAKLSSKGRLALPVTCTAATPTCTAAVTISTGTGKRKHTLCKVTTKIASGRRVSLSVPCGAAARKKIRTAAKGLPVAVAVTVTDGNGAKATATTSGKARRA